MKNPYAALMALGLMSMHMPNHYNDGSIGHGIPNNPKKIIPNGCKEYTIRGITVVAISEKSAIKKVNKILSRKP